MNWTDERVELLKKLWDDGYSASQIAAELGYITRNSVIGKIHRLGLSGRVKNPPGVTPRPRKAGRSHQSHYNGGPKPERTDAKPFKGPPMLPVEPLASVPPETFMEKLAAKLPTSCSLMELTSDKC